MINTTMDLVTEPTINNKPHVETSLSVNSLIIWLGGFGVSILPFILVILAEKIINPSNDNITTGFWNNIEIFYICVTISASALFELFSKISDKQKNHSKLTIMVIVLLILEIILSVSLYSFLFIELKVFERDYTANIIGVGKALLTTALILGGSTFFI